MPILKYYLIFDRKCNLSCVYCAQGKDKTHCRVCEKIAPKKVAQYFPEPNGVRYKVVFYGGEAFIYFDYMMEIAREIKQRNPFAELGVATNGTLLTLERAKLLNEIGITLIMSHDAYAFEETRGVPDFLKYNPEPFLAVNDKKIVSTISVKNWNYYQIWDYFENFRVKHGLTKRIMIKFCHLKDIDGYTDTSLMLYQHKEWEAMLDKAMHNLEITIRDGTFDSYEYDRYQFIIGKIYSRMIKTELAAWCGTEDDFLNIDVEGNLYDCHNCHNPVGHITTGPIKIMNSFKDTEECQRCPILKICGGGCIKAVSEKRKYFCYVMLQEYTKLLNMLQRVVDYKNIQGGVLQ
ncbi:radical SAM protein with 4Fe4S-binding SPASM domain [Hydrogenispora ethanolica]|uniref:Radical SAM protein with 4Fe4S-binding SPASM domain n=1 Tax=Hydrogenispora ethanolica TaxID=1082276 RepID=A0A4V2QGQ8_HYDET|nr:radical SAM protein [Hydrogenispora ethanolica]TCL76807.1 radical SAM protein with 4Fe4S-binding SPASM domain [Hydrogenispora ethanolica]